jgi:dipeptidase E
MRLYLSSYRLGSRAEALRWAGSGVGRALVIMNALDAYGAVRGRSWHREEADLASLGYAAAELDLRDPGDLEQRLAETDLLWVVGGNAFVLARGMTAARFGEALRAAWATQGDIVYAGYSAGACVAGPDLAGIELMDDPDARDPDAQDLDTQDPGAQDPAAARVRAQALGLVRERIVPHWRSDHPESPAAERAAEHLARRGLPYRTLRDGDDLLVGFDAD